MPGSTSSDANVSSSRMTRVEEIWRPPGPADILDESTRDFWAWMLSQTWLIGFDGWEQCLAPEETLRLDRIVAAETFLEQLRRLFGLDWHWDGLCAPGKLNAARFQEWYARFDPWVNPWVQSRQWHDVKAVRVERPSDLLWLRKLGELQPIEAVCSHSSAMKAVGEWLPGVPYRLENPPAQSGALNDDGVTLKCDAKAMRNLPAMVRECGTRHSGRIAILPWDDGWLESPRRPDRLVHEIYGYPVPWARLGPEDRPALPALDHWMNAPISRQKKLELDPQAKSSGRDESSRLDLSLEPFAAQIAGQVRTIGPGDIPLFPAAPDWCELHRRILSGIYPFAGQLRASADIVVAGRTATVQPAYLRLELHWLGQQGQQAWAAANSRAEKLATVAWAQLRFQMLHPFFDGNGHLARLWLARQALEFGIGFDPSRWESARTDYKRHVSQALAAGDAQPFLAWIGGIFGVPIEPAMFPFRVSPLLLMIFR